MYFEKALNHVKEAHTEAHAKLKRVADNILTNLDIMTEYEDEKLRIEDYTTTEIQYLFSQDIGVLMENKSWIQSLATRTVNLAEPSEPHKTSSKTLYIPVLPDPMSQLQVYFPPLPLLPITVEPIHRLHGGIIHGHQTSSTDMFKKFLAESATPAEGPNRYIYKNRVLELVDVTTYHGQLLRSIIHVHVTPDSADHLSTLINEYLATCVSHLVPDSPTLTFERIIVGVLRFKGVNKVLKTLETEFGEMYRFITIDRNSGIEKMLDAALGI